jgi:hypothetical protein
MRFWLLKKLLRWYAARELDQFDMWKTETKYGTVYITIARSSLSISHESYIEI